VFSVPALKKKRGREDTITVLPREGAESKAEDW